MKMKKETKITSSTLPTDPKKLLEQMTQTARALVSKIPTIKKKRSV
jgi:hypothetical protein